jgi:putative DNA primase/helicase
VCWHYEERKGKPTKPPIQAKSNGELLKAQTDNPATWADFETAVAAAVRLNLEGVGLNVWKDDKLTGLDLDHVFDPATGELDPLAREALDRFAGTYAEISPSGTGIRIWCYGKPQRSGKCAGRVKWLEVYSHPSHRYLTVTGNQWPGSAGAVTEQQDALDWLHGRFMDKGKDDSTGLEEGVSQGKGGPRSPSVDPSLSLDDTALLNKARQAANGAVFEALWSGDLSGHGGDHSAADLALLNALAFWTGNDAGRMDRLFRQSGLMRDKWDVVHDPAGNRTYGAMSIDKAIAGCREGYSGKRPDGGGPEKARAESGPNPQRDADLNEVDALTDEDLFSDYGNVVKLLARLSGRLAYSPGMDWLLYNPATGIWEPEPESERVKRLALEALRDAWSVVLYDATRKVDDLKKQIKDTDSDDPKSAMLAKSAKLAGSHKEKVYAWIRQCETAYRLRSTLEIAEGYFWIAPDVWDANPHILVCGNGALDLATGRLLPHSPDYRATKSTGTHFTPGATHPAWNAVVALLKSEGDRYEFIHQYCGSGLHGENPNELLVIFQGDAGTGKGTLLTGIHRALGAYAETVEVGTLLATDWRKQSKSAPREDLLKLRGARFVYPSIEPPKDSKLDDGSIKALTGNDIITARAPHAKQSISFSPVFKLALQTNFPLRTEFDDPGMKRRVIVVPFNRKPEKPDPSIKNALMNDATARAAALAWLYEGYRVWRGNGFALPTSALAAEATAGYWKDMDPYAQFAADVGLRFGKGERCAKSRITGALKAWREESGRLDATMKGFPSWLRGKGCMDTQITGGSRVWYGVGFSESSQQSPESPSVPVNKVVDFEYLNPTQDFHGTGSYSGYSSYSNNGAPPPVDSSPPPDVEEF